MIRMLFRFVDRPLRTRLLGYLGIVAITLLLVSTLLILLIPLIRALFSGDPSTALPWMGVIAGVGLAAVVGEIVGTSVGLRTGARLILCMHEAVGERILRLPLGWFDQDRTGSVSHVTSRGVPFAANALESILRPVLQATVAPAIVAGAVMVVDPFVGLTMLLGVGVVVFAWRTSRLHGRALEERADAMNFEGASRVLEFASGQPAVRTAGPDSIAERSVRGALAAQRRSSESVLRARARGMALYSCIAYIVMFAVIAVAVTRVAAGALDGPTFTAIVVLQLITTWFALHGLPFGEGLDMALRTLRDIDALLEEPLPPEPDEAGRAADGSIEFDDVTFEYTAGSPVLDGVSFTAPAGSMTAIVGSSGSGKSTIARLIARFADVDGGAIRIGGTDVRRLGTRNTLAQVSVVFQDVVLFEDTLLENIRLGRADASDEEVRDAAERAGVTEIAARLQEGFDTPVGESGGTLSGGERQRVSIARALLKRAPIMLLDEATAALDIESEALVQRSLAELQGDTTLVVIAHRLQTIRQADQIVVLDGRGGVEAVGDHTTLLETSPTYAGFWTERSESLQWSIRGD